MHHQASRPGRKTPGDNWHEHVRRKGKRELGGGDKETWRAEKRREGMCEEEFNEKKKNKIEKEEKGRGCEYEYL